MFKKEYNVYSDSDSEDECYSQLKQCKHDINFYSGHEYKPKYESKYKSPKKDVSIEERSDEHYISPTTIKKQFDSFLEK